MPYSGNKCYKSVTSIFFFFDFYTIQIGCQMTNLQIRGMKEKNNMKNTCDSLKLFSPTSLFKRAPILPFRRPTWEGVRGLCPFSFFVFRRILYAVVVTCGHRSSLSFFGCAWCGDREAMTVRCMLPEVGGRFGFFSSRSRQRTLRVEEVQSDLDLSVVADFKLHGLRSSVMVDMHGALSLASGGGLSRQPLQLRRG